MLLVAAGCSQMGGARREVQQPPPSRSRRSSKRRSPADAAVSAAGRHARSRQPGAGIAAGPIAAANPTAGRASPRHADAAARHDRPACRRADRQSTSCAAATTALAASVQTRRPGRDPRQQQPAAEPDDHQHAGHSRPAGRRRDPHRAARRPALQLRHGAAQVRRRGHAPSGGAPTWRRTIRSS